MPDNQDPIIKLEPGGKAPILSYNVPDPTSYSGRNFIDLKLPANWFKTTNELIGVSDRSLDRPVSDVEGIEEVKARLAAEGEELSHGLANLDPLEVERMERSGKRLNVYRSLYGTLTYNYLDTVVNDEPSLPALPSGAVTLPGVSELSDDEGDVREPLDPVPPDVDISISSPAEGASFSGPHTGVLVEAKGEVVFEGSRGFTTGVSVRFGSGPFLTASRSGKHWSIVANVAEPGPVRITAQAWMKRTTGGGGGLVAEASRTVNVSLTPAPDTTPPQVSIISPPAGLPQNAPASGQQFTVRGTASDPGGSGVARVEVSVDGAVFEPANPRAFNDWSEWNQSLLLTPGAHRIVARCMDRAGNIAVSDPRDVTVNELPPPDTAAPNVTISSPASPAKISGPFNEVNVLVQGTASDTGGSGVARVELVVDDDSTPPLATPKKPDWSEWSGTVRITTPGPHLVTARCYDNAGNHRESASVILDVTLVPEFVSRLDRLVLVESYRLSSYLGNYGAGRTLKTFSLLPAEKTKISIKTFTKTVEDAKSASSILDSFTQTSADNFEKSMGQEQSDEKSYKESFNYKVSGEAKASWGWGSARISGEVSGGTNAAREEFAKNISNAVEKHASEASAKRDVQVNTSYEVKAETGEETSTEREIENINVSRTLNFVFRQMNQEFITILHLVDVRIGYFHVDTVIGPKGTPEDQYTYREVTLPQLATLLEEVIADGNVPGTNERIRDRVRNDILHQLGNVFDYQDKHHSFAEAKTFVDEHNKEVPGSAYLRVKKDYTSTYLDAATGTEIKVSGIIMAADKNVLRTEGIMVEALLGQGDGLDAYSHGLQDEAVRAKEIANEQAMTEVERQRLALKIIEQRDTLAAELYEQLYPDRPVQAIPYVLAPVQEGSNGQSA